MPPPFDFNELQFHIPELIGIVKFRRCEEPSRSTRSNRRFCSSLHSQKRCHVGRAGLWGFSAEQYGMRRIAIVTQSSLEAEHVSVSRSAFSPLRLAQENAMKYTIQAVLF